MSKPGASKIGNVKLELLRPGPAHNQLLSPLTTYIALCGSDGPVTVRLPFEHRQLLMRLRRLRYPEGKDPGSDDQRQAELRDIGEAIGSVLGQIPALLAELGSACDEGGKLIHMRLSLSAFELGLIPFEAAIAPDGFAGSGSPLFLQMRTPITLTREIRRGRPLPVEWNRKPRILFAFAAPDGLYVPAREHLQALREALEPWVRIRDKDKPQERVQDVKEMLTVLPDASLEKIRKACSEVEYTHIHILAHGAEFENAGDKRFGVALCSEIGQAKDVVDGERLAIAITSRDASGTTRTRPSMVTLATCDSGNIETVITPGGSIAHELHAAGIPWVFASQFPLWMKASAIAAEVLYRGLLKGDDPRWVLYKLRQRLRTDSPGTHDWASIVAYSTVPWNFETQVEAFRDRQIRAKLEVMFARMDELVGADPDGAEKSQGCDVKDRDAELEGLANSIRSDLRRWRDEPELSQKQRAERLGMSAASEKRIGIAYQLAGDKPNSDKAFAASRNFYRRAFAAEPQNHWALTQYLAMSAILVKPSDKLRSWWHAARQISQWQLDYGEPQERIWACGTLAELAMLSVVYADGAVNRSVQGEVEEYCRQMLGWVGEAVDDFPIRSTRRQFKRYIDCWPREEWKNIAAAALLALETSD